MTRSRTHPRIALALAGGGPLGAIYEIGTITALAEALDGVDFNELDIYVGVSAGGFIAAGLANGLTPAVRRRFGHPSTQCRPRTRQRCGQHPVGERHFQLVLLIPTQVRHCRRQGPDESGVVHRRGVERLELVGSALGEPVHPASTLTGHEILEQPGRTRVRQDP